MTINFLEKLDQSLAQQYGPYASYPHETDPILVKDYGDCPADEVDRLLDIYTTSQSQVLDLGCGAGFTLCRLAPKVKAIWGFDMDAKLLEAAQLRVAQAQISNAKFVHGSVAVPEDVTQLPDKAFDLVLTRRGPDFKREFNPQIEAGSHPNPGTLSRLSCPVRNLWSQNFSARYMVQPP